MLFTDEFTENVKGRIKSKENDEPKKEGTGNLNNGFDIKHDGLDSDDIRPNDSVSNVSKHYNKSVTSNRSSTTSSAQIKAAAK